MVLCSFSCTKYHKCRFTKRNIAYAESSVARILLMMSYDHTSFCGNGRHVNSDLGRSSPAATTTLNQSMIILEHECDGDFFTSKSIIL